MNIPNTRFLYPGVLALSAMITGASAVAAPVDPASARAEAAEFLTRPMTGRKALPANPALTLAYTSETSEKLPAYYVFNHGEGFVIISADDRLPAVLGYSDNGMFDESRIPENFRWWLGEYTREISEWLPSAATELPVARTRRVAPDRPAIAPLTHTKWSQEAPYNDDCPIDASGNRSVTGCVATAMAQLMKYHEWPKQPTGSSGGVDFNGTTYDWDRMLDEYTPDNYTPAQAAAVAKLMHQCGAAVDMQYSSWFSGAYDNAVPYAFAKYFKYDPALQLVWKTYVPQTEWNEIVYGELAAGRPIYYSGSSNEGGHAFICDGYSENDYFHINWGWGGYQDGYFRLTALDPAMGGTGAYEGGYNSGQTIITGLAPSDSGGKVPQQSALVATGGFFYDPMTALYEIREDPKGYNLMYNPLIYEETLNVGMKFTEIGDPDAKPVYSECGSVTLQSQYGIGQLYADTPDLPDGIYSITPVFAEEGMDWQPVLIPLGMQNFVRLTVSGDQYLYENVGPDESTRSDVIVNMPLTTPVIYGNAYMAFRIPVLNVGQGDFTGSLGLTLIQKDTSSPDSISDMLPVPVSGKSYTEVDLSFSEPISPGTYSLYVSDQANNMLIDGAEVKVVDGDFPAMTPIDDVIISPPSPNFITSEMENPVYFTINSRSSYDERVDFNFTVLDARSLTKVKELECRYSVIAPPGFLGRMTVPPVDFGLDPGQYMWYVCDHDGNALSVPSPLIVTSPVRKAGALRYVVTDESRKLARLVAPESGAYTIGISVPSTVGGYTINEISPDAFAFAESQGIALPPEITKLPDGAFYDARALRNLALDANSVVKAARKTFNPEYAAECYLQVPEDLTYTYRATGPWSTFRMTNWELQLEDVEITSGMIVDPATGKPYSPYYVNCLTPVTVTLSAPDGMNVEVLVVHNGEWLEYHTIDPRTTTLTLPALGRRGWGRLQATATTNPVAVDVVTDDGAPADVYSIDGRLILNAATPEEIRSLAPGIYIISGRKYIIR